MHRERYATCNGGVTIAGYSEVVQNLKIIKSER